MSSLCQQGELYEAEERALARVRELVPQLSVDQAQSLVDTWVDLPWWRERFPGVLHVEVLSEPHWTGSAGALIDDWAVCEMDAEHLNALFVAHEVCHPLTQARYGDGSHSPWFTRTYLELVYLGVGSEVYAALYEEFELAGIDHRTDG